jgi:hypothetical protein
MRRQQTAAFRLIENRRHALRRFERRQRLGRHLQRTIEDAAEIPSDRGR